MSSTKKSISTVVIPVTRVSMVGGWIWYSREIGFCLPGTRDTSLGGRCPLWPVGDCRKASDAHPPPRGDWDPVGRTQLTLSHKQTSSNPTRHFRLRQPSMTVIHNLFAMSVGLSPSCLHILYTSPLTFKYQLIQINGPNWILHNMKTWKCFRKKSFGLINQY